MPPRAQLPADEPPTQAPPSFRDPAGHTRPSPHLIAPSSHTGRRPDAASPSPSATPSRAGELRRQHLHAHPPPLRIRRPNPPLLGARPKSTFGRPVPYHLRATPAPGPRHFRHRQIPSPPMLRHIEPSSGVVTHRAPPSSYLPSHPLRSAHHTSAAKNHRPPRIFWPTVGIHLHASRRGTVLHRAQRSPISTTPNHPSRPSIAFPCAQVSHHTKPPFRRRTEFHPSRPPSRAKPFAATITPPRANGIHHPIPSPSVHYHRVSLVLQQLMSRYGATLE